MRVSISLRRVGAAIGMALLSSTVGMIGLTPAYGHDAAPTSAVTTGEPNEQREIASFEADISRLNHDIASLPPEVNSALSYDGAGSAPLLAAAQAWDGLAAELQAAANSYSSVTSGLAGESWLGPASSATAATAAPDVASMQTTAHEAEHVAAQAEAEAATFARIVNGPGATG